MRLLHLDGRLSLRMRVPVQLCLHACGCFVLPLDPMVGPGFWTPSRLSVCMCERSYFGPQSLVHFGALD